MAFAWPWRGCLGAVVVVALREHAVHRVARGEGLNRSLRQVAPALAACARERNSDQERPMVCRHDQNSFSSRERRTRFQTRQATPDPRASDEMMSPEKPIGRPGVSGNAWPVEIHYVTGIGVSGRHLDAKSCEVLPLLAMVSVRVLVPGDSPPLERTLVRGVGLLVGRRPDPEKVPVELSASIQTVELVVVPSPLVSEQHCVLWTDGARVFMRDLRSTNGTRLLLPPDVTIEAPDGRAVLELGAAVDDIDELPRSLDWTNASDFRAGVCDAVNRWLSAQAIRAAVALTPTVESGSKRDIPLGDGWGLRVSASGDNSTRDARLDRALPTLWAFALAQRGEFELDRDSEHAHDELVLESQAIRALHRRICQAARRGLHGVLQGETGAGKSAFARCFHVHSERRGGAFVETNLAEDSDDRKYFQLKLFGARAGASSTILHDQVGLVSAAHRGTLFLDEVGLLPLDVQGLLLRFLDRGTYRRLGDPGDAPERRADVRVVVGTNLDLREAVRRGAFREDLWWRLSGIVLEVPPLRERPEDIEAVLRRERITLRGGDVSVYDALTKEARHFLVRTHPWRGNFRELHNMLARLPLYVDDRRAIDLDLCVAVLSAGSIHPVATPCAPSELSDRSGDGSDLLPLAQQLLPLWLAGRARRGDDVLAEPRSSVHFRILYDEVLRPLCIARALGVEHWDQVPRRPEPSFRAMAASLGYSDGRTVHSALTIYVELKRLRAGLEGG